MKVVKDVIYYPGEESCRLDLYLPEVRSGKVPLYVAIHGGGLVCGDKTDTDRRAMAEVLTQRGIALASVNYRMYPQARYPDFISDVAEAVTYLMNKASEYGDFGDFAIGGESAGGYITQMLYFNKGFLQNAGADRSRIKAFVMDAGQPTTHFNILKMERGVDSRAVVIDEAAALYYLREEYSQPEKEPYVAIFAADHDMINRMEQNKMLETAMLHFGFPREKLLFHIFEGFYHCAYCATEKYHNMLADFLNKAFTDRGEKG